MCVPQEPQGGRGRAGCVWGAGWGGWGDAATVGPGDGERSAAEMLLREKASESLRAKLSLLRQPAGSGAARGGGGDGGTRWGRGTLKCSIILPPRQIPRVCGGGGGSKVSSCALQWSRGARRGGRGGGGRLPALAAPPRRSGARRGAARSGGGRGAGTAEPAALPVQRLSIAGERGAPGGGEGRRMGGGGGAGGDASWLG